MVREINAAGEIEMETLRVETGTEAFTLGVEWVVEKAGVEMRVATRTEMLETGSGMGVLGLEKR